MDLKKLKIINNNTFFRFVLAGIVNTIFGWLVFSFFIFLDFAIPIALMFGTVIGTLFNYLTFGGYTFHKFSIKIFYKFIFTYFFIYITNLFLLNMILSLYDDVTIIQLFLLPFMALLSFVIMKNFVFK